ncbi:MAG: hypothetical protein ACM3SQ_05895 [Betaproteobacteria bacterium]
MRLLTTIVLAIVTVRAGAAQSMPQGMTHEQHMAQMQHDAELKRRGAMAMGFDQDKTFHSFRLAENGGSIEVSVKDSADTADRDAIRAHLREIAKSFAAGNFEKPMMTHGEEPDGVAVMKRLKSAITYRYEETPAGGRVRISTADVEALKAVHAFLRYQIREHGTDKG